MSCSGFSELHKSKVQSWQNQLLLEEASLQLGICAAASARPSLYLSLSLSYSLSLSLSLSLQTIKTGGGSNTACVAHVGRAIIAHTATTSPINKLKLENAELAIRPVELPVEVPAGAPAGVPAGPAVEIALKRSWR